MWGRFVARRPPPRAGGAGAHDCNLAFERQVRQGPKLTAKSSRCTAVPRSGPVRWRHAPRTLLQPEVSPPNARHTRCSEGRSSGLRSRYRQSSGGFRTSDRSGADAGASKGRAGSGPYCHIESSGVPCSRCKLTHAIRSHLHLGQCHSDFGLLFLRHEARKVSAECGQAPTDGCHAGRGFRLRASPPGGRAATGPASVPGGTGSAPN